MYNNAITRMVHMYITNSLLFYSDVYYCSIILKYYIALVAYIAGTTLFANYHVGEREAGTGSATLPLEMTAPAHVWVFYWNGQKSPIPGRENVSESVYLGMV